MTRWNKILENPVARAVNLYSVYDRQGNAVITQATAVECAKAMGIGYHTFFMMKTPSHKRTQAKWEIIKEGENPDRVVFVHNFDKADASAYQRYRYAERKKEAITHAE